MGSLHVKTPKGIEEIERRAHGLPGRRRKVLILIDGKRDEKALSDLVPGEDVPAVMQALLNEGFITPLVPASNLPSASPAPHKAPADDAERFGMARNFMINTTRAYIGHNGSSLINHLDDCADLAGLRSHFNAWREAIQLSRDGKKAIGDLENKLAALLS